MSALRIEATRISLGLELERWPLLRWLDAHNNWRDIWGHFVPRGTARMCILSNDIESRVVSGKVSRADVDRFQRRAVSALCLAYREALDELDVYIEFRGKPWPIPMAVERPAPPAFDVVVGVPDWMVEIARSVHHLVEPKLSAASAGRVVRVNFAERRVLQ